MARVLITDDSAFMRELIKDVIWEAGYETFFATSGDELLELYEAIRPDVVLLDIVLPGKDGIQTLKELKAKYPDAKVIMCSALIEQKKLRDSAEENGAFICLKKPFGGPEIVDAIKKALESQ